MINHLNSKEYLELDNEFIIPQKIKNNQHKLIYTVGYLKGVYEHVYPCDSNKSHFEKIKLRWNIFKSHRQMERLWNQYIKLKKKGEI